MYIYIRFSICIFIVISLLLQNLLLGHMMSTGCYKQLMNDWTLSETNAALCWLIKFKLKQQQKPSPSPVIPFKVIHTRHLEALPNSWFRAPSSLPPLASLLECVTTHSTRWLGENSKSLYGYFFFTGVLLSVSTIWNTYSFNSIMYLESIHFSLTPGLPPYATAIACSSIVAYLQSIIHRTATGDLIKTMYDIVIVTALVTTLQ